MDGITNTMDMDLGGLRALVMDREAWRAVVLCWGHKELDTTERLMLKPKLQYFGHFMRRVNSLEKT